MRVFSNSLYYETLAKQPVYDSDFVLLYIPRQALIYDFLTECAVTVANQDTGSGRNLLKTGNRLLKTPAPLWPSKFVFVILIKYLACLLQYKTVSRIW